MAPGPRQLALIFDLDGVIVDSRAVHTGTWREYLRQFGRELPDTFAREIFGRHNDDIVRRLFGGPLSHAEIVAHGAAKEALYRVRVKPLLKERLVAGVAAFIAQHAGWPMAVASNAERANVEFVLQTADLGRFFRVVVDGQQVERPKPGPEIYLLAAERLGARPADCVVFEDSYAGVEAARSAGTRVVGVQTTHTELAGADLLIRNFLAPELEPWLGARYTVNRST